MDNDFLRNVFTLPRNTRTLNPDFAQSLPLHKIAPLPTEEPEEPGNAIKISRNLIGRTVQVTSTATQLVDVTYPRVVLITNPAVADTLSQTSTAYSGIANASGNSQTTPIDVRNSIQVHAFLNVTAIAGNWDFILQTYDSVNNTWADSQTLVAGLAATGDKYYYIGSNAIAEKIAFRWIQNVGATSITFSIITVEKFYENFIPDGLSQTVYIGARGVTTVSGYPILGGQEKQFILAEGLELWGISNVAVNLRIFSL